MLGMEGHRKGAEGAEAVQRAQRGHGWHVEEALGHREGAEGYRGSMQGYGGGMDRVQKGATIDINNSCIPLVTQRDCAVHTYSVTAASTFMGKLQPFSYEARTEAC